MDEVLAIERSAFEQPWFEEDFIKCLRQRNCIGMVAESPASKKDCGPILGFMIYELYERRFDIVNFAVGTAWHRRGVGSAMVEKLVGKLSTQRRTRLNIEIRETNLGAHLFFSAMGFKATHIIPNSYDDDEDAYFFSYCNTRKEVPS